MARRGRPVPALHIWRQPAENVAETLTRGARVIVQGRLEQRSFETREGEKRTVIELEVDEIGPSLRYATASVTKASRSTGGGASGGERPSAPAAEDPWAAAPVGASSTAGGYGDEPPF